jgi:phytoene synthase
MGMLEKGLNSSPFNNELGYTVEKFRIPLWSLEAFADSMLYDVTHDGFASVADFIEYSEGASVAPASIFVHLAGLHEKDGIYPETPFDVRRTAAPCAMFSYFVHIMSDFRKDQLNNLSYFADDVLKKHAITRSAMSEMAHGATLTPGFRAMMREYLMIADRYRIFTVKMMDEICPMMEPRYRLSLEIIFELYMMVFERIDPEHGTFSTEELNPTPAQTRERMLMVIMRQ